MCLDNIKWNSSSSSLVSPLPLNNQSLLFGVVQHVMFKYESIIRTKLQHSNQTHECVHPLLLFSYYESFNNTIDQDKE